MRRCCGGVSDFQVYVLPLGPCGSLMHPLKVTTQHRIRTIAEVTFRIENSLLIANVGFRLVGITTAGHVGGAIRSTRRICAISQR